MHLGKVRRRVEIRRVDGPCGLWSGSGLETDRVEWARLGYKSQLASLGQIDPRIHSDFKILA